jgi:hypothetical protein
MSGPAPQGAEQSSSATRSEDTPASASFRIFAITLTGALLTASVLAASLGSGSMGRSSTGSGEPTLSMLAQNELSTAIGTLDPTTSQQAVADAKACKVPMAWVTVVKQAGGSAGAIRIRSGSYVTPAIAVTDVPQRVAIPFPAPYATGQGFLSVMGEANGVAIYLTPGWSLQNLNGAASIAVRWNPGHPC